MQAKLKIGPKTGRRRRTGSICGRLLLLRGLQELGYDQLFPQNKDPEQLLEALAASLEKGPYGKPYLTGYPEIHFNISHSGDGRSAPWLPCPAGWTFRKDGP